MPSSPEPGKPIHAVIAPSLYPGTPVHTATAYKVSICRGGLDPSRRAEKGLRGAADLGQEAEATEDGGAVPDLDWEAEPRRTDNWWRRTTR
uniref:Uncharacterized protein n=1 Tax=Oryza barthii TaxID=65489 RepID=A0A0D3H3E3_9ORYZ